MNALIEINELSNPMLPWTHQPLSTYLYEGMYCRLLSLQTITVPYKNRSQFT